MFMEGPPREDTSHAVSANTALGTVVVAVAVAIAIALALVYLYVISCKLCVIY